MITIQCFASSQRRECKMYYWFRLSTGRTDGVEMGSLVRPRRPSSPVRVPPQPRATATLPTACRAGAPLRPFRRPRGAIHVPPPQYLPLQFLANRILPMSLTYELVSSFRPSLQLLHESGARRCCTPPQGSFLSDDLSLSLIIYLSICLYVMQQGEMQLYVSVMELICLVHM